MTDKTQETQALDIDAIETTFGPYDAHDPPPIDFEGWVDVSVALIDRTLDERDDVFDQRELDPRLWHAVDKFWLGELAKQVARQNFKLATRFGERCAQELAARRSTPPPNNLDDTGATKLMMALPDDTALPFKTTFAAAPPSAAELSGEHDAFGKTMEVAALGDEPPLPFDDGNTS